MEVLGKLLRDRRFRANLMPFDLGARIEVQPARILGIEKGAAKVEIGELLAIAHALGIKLGPLIEQAERELFARSTPR
jgi:transcriptional regulator with XRE-family HTH domain